MENDLRKINSVEDLAIELLGIFKDGVVSRIIAGKTKPLTYRVSRLKYWAIKDNININGIEELINICNKYIEDSSKNYEVVGRLEIKGKDIVEFSKG